MHRAEGVITLRNLPYLRPIVFYLFGDKACLSTGNDKMEEFLNTGVGVGDSRGSETGHSRLFLVIAEWLVAYLVKYRTTDNFMRLMKAENQIRAC